MPNNQDIIRPLLAALLATGLFLLVFGTGLGFLFMFLPTLPLFALGLSRPPKLALHAACYTTIMIGLALGLPSAILFLLFLGLPAWIISKQSLLWRLNDESERVWFPLGLIFVHLTLWACALVALMTAYYAGDEGGIPLMLSKNIHAAFADLQGVYGDVINELAGPWSFLIFSTTIWMWSLALYAHAWLANRALVRQHKAIRPDYALTPFPIPNWMLTLLAICALASLIGSDSMRFLGKSTLISLLLPYFFLGASLLHRLSAAWPNRRFFLFFVYFSIFAQFWPALIVSGFGLWHHIKHLSTSATSSKS